MFLKEITIQNLLSYNEKQRILFSNNSIILGTNNSGKSNIFRIVTILINELLHHNSNLYEQLTFSKDGEPYINIKLQFNDTEVNLLIDYLFYIYGIQVSDPRMDFNINYPNLRILLKDISIRMNWYKYSLQEYMTSKIEIEFENLKLSLIATEGSYGVKFDNNDYFLSNPLIEHIGKLKSPNFEDFKSYLKNVLDHQEPQQTNLYPLHKKLQIPPEGLFPPQLKRITNIKNYFFFDKLENIDFLTFLGHLIRNNIIFKTKSEIQSFEEDNDNNFQLNNKGNNLARFLFRIKNSNSHIERYKFILIQDYFSQIFENVRIDVIREYHTEIKKYIIKIIIHEKEINKDLDFDFIGEGIKEIIFLLSLSLGVENKVMCFDEPALNFHPLLLKSVFNKITSTNIKYNNQLFQKL